MSPPAPKIKVFKPEDAGLGGFAGRVPSHGAQPRQGRHLCRTGKKNIFKLRQERHLRRVANTYAQIYIHVVFAVEGRQNLILAEHNDELQKYITGIVSGQRQKMIAINNVPDHVHLLVGLRPDSSLSDLVRDVKAGSSKIISQKRWVAGRFSWQEGFGAFSYSRSQLGAVIRYIENQQKHHAKKTFREEYVKLLERFNVDFDPRYIFSDE
jgi:REP element-mobilizing transposase RayT